MTILFLHGWNSVPGGVKPTFLAQQGHKVVNPKLSDDDFDGAVRVAQVDFDKSRPDLIVGSSRGGAVAMNIDANTTPFGPTVPGMEEVRHCQDRQARQR